MRQATFLQALLHTKKEFKAARSIGGSTPYILRQHLTPNVIGPRFVRGTLQIPGDVLLETFLAHLQPTLKAIAFTKGWNSSSLSDLFAMSSSR